MDARPEVPLFVRLAAHPLRWRLITELAASDLRVRDLVERVAEPQSLVSYHLRLLRDGSLVRARRSSHDGRDLYYHLELDHCAGLLAATGSALHPGLQLVAAPPLSTTTRAARVLFVCTGNSARSPIAEALLRHRTEGRVVTASAGITPRAEIHPHAVEVVRTLLGIDIGGQVPRAVDEVAGRGPDLGFDRVVTLCDRARAHLRPVEEGRRTHWSLPDPADAPGRTRRASFASVAADIDARVRHLIPTL